MKPEHTKQMATTSNMQGKEISVSVVETIQVHGTPKDKPKRKSLRHLKMPSREISVGAQVTTQAQATPQVKQKRKSLRYLDNFAIDCDGNITQNTGFLCSLFCTRNYGVVFVAMGQIIMGFITATVQVIRSHDVAHPTFVLNMLIAMLSIVMGIATVASLGVRIKSCLASLLILICLFVAGLLGSSLPKERWNMDVGDKENNQIVSHTNWYRCMAMEGSFRDDCLLHFMMARLSLLVLALVQLALAIAATVFIALDAFPPRRSNRVQDEEAGDTENKPTDSVV